MCVCFSGNALLLVVLAAKLSPTVHTYLLLSILGLELLVAVPCLLYYTGKLILVISCLVLNNGALPADRHMFKQHYFCKCLLS